MPQDTPIPERPFADLTLPMTPSKGGLKVEDAKGHLHYLNQSAAVVLLLCDGSRTIREIERAVCAEFGLEQTPTDEVNRALQLLMDRGLLQSG